MLGEHLDHPAGPGQVLIDLGSEELGVPLFVGHLEDRLQSVGRGLVGPEDAEVVRVEPDHIGQPLPEDLGGLRQCGTRDRYVDAVVAEIRQAQVLQQQAAVGVRIVAHPQMPRRRQFGDGRDESSRLVEQFVCAVGRQPIGQHLKVFRGIAGAGQRNLVGPPRTGGLLPVDMGRAGPALRVAEDDHRPTRPALIAGGGAGLDCGDLIENIVEQPGEPAVGVGVIVILADVEEVRIVAVADHQAA